MIRTHEKTPAITTIGFFVAAIVATACSGAAPVDSGNLGGDTGNQTSGPGTTGTGTGGKPKTSPSGTSTPPSSSKDGGAPSNPTPSSPGGGDAGTAAGMCASSSNQDTCAQCCDPNGATGAADQAFGDCVCQAPGTCKTECGNTFCAGQAPSAACSTCLDAAQQCEQVAQTACDGNAACAAASKCMSDSRCAQKPQK